MDPLHAALVGAGIVILVLLLVGGVAIVVGRELLDRVDQAAAAAAQAAAAQLAELRARFEAQLALVRDDVAELLVALDRARSRGVDVRDASQLAARAHRSTGLASGGSSGDMGRLLLPPAAAEDPGRGDDDPAAPAGREAATGPRLPPGRVDGLRGHGDATGRRPRRVVPDPNG